MNYLAKVEEAQHKDNQLKKTVHHLLDLLNTTELSEFGRVHHPVQITCSRSDLIADLEECLKKLEWCSRWQLKDPNPKIIKEPKTYLNYVATEQGQINREVKQ